MSEENTQNLNDSRSFEERVFARFDAMDASIDARFDRVDSSIQELDARVERLEARSYDTKPIWEQALKEILETKAEIAETKLEVAATKLEVAATKLEVIDTRRELFKRLDRLGAATLENRADIREAEDRIEKLESKLSQ